jgi:alpha-L-fucosidase
MWGSRQASAADTGQRGAWLAESRFAMFIHWGLYSELGARWQGQTCYGIAEWIMNRLQIPVAEYEQVAQRFNPTGFDAAEWAALARDAGMRHLMITAKHHDGFAMFRSAAHPYNIADATPFGRDPLAELAAACRAEGLRLGFYYSQTLDWHEPDAVGNTWDFPAEDRDFGAYLRAKAIPQIEELLTGYGPVAGIWFDCPGPITPEDSRSLVELVHRLQPDCLVNSRIGNDLGDYDSLGDQEIPRLPRPGLWETPDTHNDTWAYAWYDHNWKSPRELAERLVRVVSRGGTYLLNVGPDGSGRIPEQSARILRQLGRWVQAHEAAIHGAGPTPFGPLAWGECTIRGQTLYLHVFQWPADGRLIVPGLKTAVRSAQLDGVDLPLAVAGELLAITLPPSPPDSLIPVVTLDLAGPPAASRAQFVLNGCVNTLETRVAALSGCELRAVSWMEKFGDWHHAECLGGWQADGEDGLPAAAWEFQTVAPGAFYLDLEYTCPAADDYAEWRLAGGAADVTFPLIDTGERASRQAFYGELPRFRWYRVGVVEFPEAGPQRLTLAPTGSAGAGVRVAGLRLTPVAGLG